MRRQLRVSACPAGILRGEQGTDGLFPRSAQTLAQVRARCGWCVRAHVCCSNLISAFGAIGEMADRLGLVPTIKDRANELFRDISDLKSIRGRSASAVHAACLYIACRQEDKPRTFKEICAVARDTNTREIGRCFKFILKVRLPRMGGVRARTDVREPGRTQNGYVYVSYAKGFVAYGCTQVSRSFQWGGRDMFSLGHTTESLCALVKLSVHLN